MTDCSLRSRSSCSLLCRKFGSASPSSSPSNCFLYSFKRSKAPNELYVRGPTRLKSLIPASVRSDREWS